MMATGYVHPVADGKVTDLKTFALQCSRAMMALVTMRDENGDVLPPRRLEPELEYLNERLATAQARMRELVAMDTTEKREAAYRADIDAQIARAKEFDAKDDVEIERVRAMREKVALWSGAPDGLKEFMLDQLDRTLDGTGHYRSVDHIKDPGPSAWYDDQFRSAKDAVGRAFGEIEAEKARTEIRNQWLDKLWTSLESVE